MTKSGSIFKKLNLLLLGVGPGTMAIGYTIGTGSVTSMIVSGNKFGMDLLWVLYRSCFFSWILMNAYGRYTLVTGETRLLGICRHMKYGNIIATLIIVGITIGLLNSLIGILGISADASVCGDYLNYARYPIIYLLGNIN